MKLREIIMSKLRLRSLATRGVGKQQGQSVVELALTLPLLVLLFAIVIDGGLALNSWVRVNTAARDGTRFALDAGRDNDVKDLVISKLNGLDLNQVDVYIIKDTTDNNGNINAQGNGGWKTSSVVYHYGPGDAVAPRIQPATIEARLNVPDNATANDNVPFTIVEVDYQYATLLGSFLNQSTIPMTSYALMQQYIQ